MVDYRESGYLLGTGKVDPEQLMEFNRRRFKRKLSGIDVIIPKPPKDLLETMETLQVEGISKFEPFYTPSIISKLGYLPDFLDKPEWWFLSQIANGRLSEDAETIRSGWYLVDTCRKPNLEKGENRYEDDYLGPIMQKLRREGEIYTFRKLPEDSRLGASPNEIQNVIMPELSRARSIPQARSMRAIEFNVWGKMSHPEWGETDTLEWFEDELKGSVGPLTLIGGSSKRGGLSDIGFGWPYHRHADAGFRLVIPFPQKP